VGLRFGFHRRRRNFHADSGQRILVLSILGVVLLFLRHFFIGIAILALTGATITGLIDPYSIFNSPEISGFNTHKSPGSPRLFKPLQASARQADTVMLGSSRVQVGLNPDDLPNAYNFGIPGVLAAEMLIYGNHVMTDTSAKQLIIGLDFLTFNDDMYVRAGLATAVTGRYTLLRAIPKTLFSYEALARSRKTFRLSFKKKTVYHRANGFFLMRPHKDKTSSEAMLGSVSDFLSPGRPYNNKGDFHRSLGALDALIAAAVVKGIKIDLFFSPTHSSLMEALTIAGLGPGYEAWKRGVVEISARNGAALWDFGGYTRLTTIDLSDAQQNFIDASHYRPEVGRRILSIMDGRRPVQSDVKSLGVRLTPENFDDHLRTQRLARAAYRATHPADVAAIKHTACSSKHSGNFPGCPR
jgi:hypothetical protein